ncbi:MAG TPA: hypothetical protein VMS84_07635 [Mycobacterium sp.]|jgi:hypothetical protein|nr:hypothetical protein [Mycobacterium sp.]
MSDSTSSSISRPRFGGGGRLYREEDAPAAAAMGLARESIEEARVAEMMAPEAPPWADQPEPEPERKVEPKRKRKSEPERERTVENPPPMKVGRIEEPKAPRDRRGEIREVVSTGLELVGIGLLITTGFLITAWLGTLIAGLCLVLLGVATSRNFSG